MLKTSLPVLCLLIAVLALPATLTGIFSSSGPGPTEILSVRGTTVTLHGYGLYKHMSRDVAVQGIAQDWISLAVIPVLLVAAFKARKGSLKAALIRNGTLLYFFLTYLFYLVMAMYNEMFLLYIALLGSSFFALVIAMHEKTPESIKASFSPCFNCTIPAILLIVNAILICLLWLSIIIPPLIQGQYPQGLDHYTTMIVQGLDLSLFLPAGVISGVLIARKHPLGYLLAPTYLVFLTILMSALLAKLAGMAMTGTSIIPSIFIIPVILTATTVTTWYSLHSVRTEK